MIWPFSSQKSRSKRIEECDHEFEEDIQEFAYPNHINFDDGQPYVNRVTIETRGCSKCIYTERKRYSEEKVYLSVEEIEEVNK